MPPLPRDCDYKRLLVLLKKYEYEIVRQKGSHIRVHSTRYSHSITVPAHSPLKIGTLNGIISDLSARVQESREDLISKL